MHSRPSLSVLHVYSPDSLQDLNVGILSNTFKL